MGDIEFTGDGGKDVEKGPADTNAPKASQGGSPDINWTGYGGSDVDYNSHTTNNPAGKMAEGGPIDSPVE